MWPHRCWRINSCRHRSSANLISSSSLLSERKCRLHHSSAVDDKHLSVLITESRKGKSGMLLLSLFRHLFPLLGCCIMHVCGGWQQLVGVGEETLAAIFGRGSAGDIPLSVYAFFPSFPSTFLGVAPCRRPIGPEGGGAKMRFFGEGTYAKREMPACFWAPPSSSSNQICGKSCWKMLRILISELASVQNCLCRTHIS